MIDLRVFGTLALESASREGAALLVAQPKAAALVVFLAIARPRGFHRRDRLVGLLWPDGSQQDARAALRKTLDRVRELLGDDVFVSRGTELLAVAQDRVQCDAIAFAAAIDDGFLRDALDLYSGPLLPGFHVTDAGDFDNWLEEERAHYADCATNSAWKLVEQYEANSELTNASQLARRVARLRPTDERNLRKVLTMLARLGDRAAAVAEYKRFTDRLWKDYETRPSDDTQRLIESIKVGVT
jgi:serine/threonine-protein kinase